MTDQQETAGRFRYDGYEINAERGTVTCRYSVGKRSFTERVTLGPGPGWRSAAADAAARLLHLMAGVSYYKTSAPLLIDLGSEAITEQERAFLHTFYVDGLSEFSYRNGLDLSGLRFSGPTLARRKPVAGPGPEIDRPLVPFGGGIDSIVTVETVRARHPQASLLVVHRDGDRFEAIERPARLTGLPVRHAGREIDPALFRSNEFGFLNGHVPVTGILSAIAVLTAVVDGHDSVVMSNEWSASSGNLTVDGRTVNHQWSKGIAFELAFRDVLSATFEPAPQYFSLLRPYSELWVASRFAALTRYHLDFRSCNRAFHQDPATRLDEWCGRCDKCCFIDLVLAPYLPPATLSAVFNGREPLEDPTLVEPFRALLGSDGTVKPFECVGDVGECRSAVRMAAARPDRAGNTFLQTLAAAVGPEPGAGRTEADLSPDDFLRPIGEHRVPDGYAPEDLLV